MTFASLLATSDPTVLVRLLFAQSRDALWIVSGDGQRITDANAAAEAFTGHSRSRLLGLPLSSIFAADDINRLNSLFEVNATQSESLAIRTTLRVAESQTAARDVVRLSVMRLDEKGTQFLVTAHLGKDVDQLADDVDNADVMKGGSSLPLAEGSQEVENDRGRLDALLSDVDGAIWEADIHPWRYRYVSPRIEEMFGYPLSEWLDGVDIWRRLVHQDDLSITVDFLQSSAILGCDHQVDFRAVRSDGEVIWMHCVVHVVKDAAGTPQSLRGVMFDITKRKSVEESLRVSEDRFRSLIENAPVCIHEIGLDGRLRSMNRAGLALAHVANEAEVIGVHYLDFVEAGDRDRIGGLLTNAFCGTPSSFEFNASVCGESRLFSSNFIPIRDGDQRVIRLMGVTEDITDRRRNEETLRESEERLRKSERRLLDAELRTRLGSWEFHHGRGSMIWSDGMLRLFQMSSSDPIPTTIPEFLELFHPEDRMLIRSQHDAVWRGIEMDSTFDVRTNPATTPMRWLSESVYRIPYEDRVDHYSAGTLLDITDRRLAEEALRVRDHAIASAMIPFVLGGMDGQITYVNQAFLDLLGFDDAEQVIGLHNSEFRCRPISPAEINRQILEDGQWSGEVTTYRVDGTPIDVKLSARVVYDRQQKPVCTFATFVDVTEEKRAQRALMESESNLRLLFDNVPAVIFAVNSDGRILLANRGFEGSQSASVVGKFINELIPAESNYMLLRDLQRVVDTGEAQRRELQFCDAQGVSIWYSYRLVAINRNQVAAASDAPSVLVVCVDVTERKLAEAKLHERETQLAHVSRLSTMGELVAGIAHEVNQPLYSIVNYSRATRNALGSDDSIDIKAIEEWNEEIGRAASRAGQIIKKLRTFVAHREAPHQPFSLNEVILEAVEYVRYEANRDQVTICFELPSESPVVVVDQVQVQQVIVNLLMNAFEAMEASQSEHRQVTIGLALKGSEAELTIADTGPGLPEDSQPGIFDPFVTTKPNGMGMGLAISQSIVAACGGHLWGENMDDGGARFHVLLPLAPSSPDVSDSSEGPWCR